MPIMCECRQPWFLGKERESDQGCTTRGDATWPEPLLLTLRLGYTWVVIGTALLGVSILDVGGASRRGPSRRSRLPSARESPNSPKFRVTLGHTGRDLTA